MLRKQHSSHCGIRTLLFMALALLVASHAFAIELLVYNNSGDNVAGSLRKAISDNNALGGGNTIVFSNEVTGTITLTSGELAITANVTILGPGPDKLTINGNNASRLFSVTNATAAISGLGVAVGFALNSEAGGIRNAGTLVLSNCVVRNCYGGNGGGLYNHFNSTLTVVNSTICNNSSGGNAGGVANFGTLRLIGSSIVSNAYTGGFLPGNFGGVFGAGAMTNCTVMGNSGGEAAIGSSGGVLWSTTISGNAGHGVSGNNTIVGNCIIAENAGSSDTFGTFTSVGYNLIGRTNFSSGWGAVGDQVGSASNPIFPQLLPLGHYGGAMPTMPPESGSRVIDQGKNFGMPTDQRGRPRTRDVDFLPNATLGDGTDIGAVELGNGFTLVVTNSNDSGPGSLRQAILDASPIELDRVTFAPYVTNTITLTSGELVVNKSLTIAGPGADVLRISGNNASRVFHFTGSGVSLFDLTIANGLADRGAGICLETGSYYIDRCQIVSNTATLSGGSLCLNSNASLQIAWSSILHNQAAYVGGGIAHLSSVGLFMSECTIASNRTTAIPKFVLIRGGGIGLGLGSPLSVLGSTIVGNHSTSVGGGIDNLTASPGSVQIWGSIVADNTAAVFGPDVAGDVAGAEYNLIGRSDGSTGLTNGVNNNQVGTSAAPLNPMVGALGNYGGRTPTIVLRSGSPAIDKGNGFGREYDQRGFPRRLDVLGIPDAGDGADIGAFEVDPNLRIVDVRRTGNDVGLSLMSVLGRNYRVEHTNSLASGNWTTFTNNAPGNGWLLWVTNYGGANQPRRFYRGAIVP